MFKELKVDASSEIVAQINENVLEDVLRSMDAHVDKWGQSLEAFLDKFIVRLQQLNDSRDTPVPDKDALSWLMKSLRGHSGAEAMVNSIQQLLFHQRRIDPTYQMSFDAFVDSLRLSFQHYNRDHKPKSSHYAPCDWPCYLANLTD